MIHLLVLIYEGKEHAEEAFRLFSWIQVLGGRCEESRKQWRVSEIGRISVLISPPSKSRDRYYDSPCSYPPDFSAPPAANTSAVTTLDNTNVRSQVCDFRYVNAFFLGAILYLFRLLRCPWRDLCEVSEIAID